VLDVFSAGWVGKRLAQGVVAEMLPNVTHDPAYSSRTPMGSLHP